MKRILIVLAFFSSLSIMTAQVDNVNLQQVKGAFTTESLNLNAGKYQFNIANNDVDHEVGFVLVPKGKYAPEYHIKEAYVNAPVAKGKNADTKVVNLSPGEYEYFCPLNPTPKYALTVHDKVKSVKLKQKPGKFTKKKLTLKEGAYQFEIANVSVDHEVGFVLVPKGKYEPEHHIKAAYVSAPVSTGSSSDTGIVNLKAGEYEYFCPLNPTPKYTVTVK